MSLINLPREIIDLIFNYLHKEHIVYSFLELNNYFSLIVESFIGNEINLTKIHNDIIFQYCLTNVLPLIGYNIRYLTIGYPYCLSNYIEYIKIFCPNLDTLNIYCYSEKEDIRLYVAHFVHEQLISLKFTFNNQIVDEQISRRLLKKSIDDRYEKFRITSSLILNLSSMNDLILLKRYSESNYLSNGLYMIESLLTNEWLTDSKDDLCIMSKKLHREHIFSIKHINNNQYSLEYELYHEQTECRLTVVPYYEDEEHWKPSSILSAHREKSFGLCSTFTFEKIDNQNQFYIRPCYTRAKRLQASGKRVIVSLCDNENTLNHRFRLHRIL